MSPIRLHIVSTHRADLGHLEPLLEAAKKDPRFTVWLSCPNTVNLAPANDEVVFFQGDRTELLHHAADAITAGAVIAHAAGGEVTKGSTDNTVRNAMTKLAHLHYPVHQDGYQRIVAMGEEPWRICIAGEIGHDAMVDAPCPVDAKPDDLVVAYHPVTTDQRETLRGLLAIHRIVKSWPGSVWLTEPNGDPGSEDILSTYKALSGVAGVAKRCPSLGHDGFRALVKRCGYIVGNSSALITEAPMLGAYPILIGTRQEGRQHSEFKTGACALILDHIAQHRGNPHLRIK